MKPKWELRIEKEIEEYWGEVSIIDEMNKSVKEKTRKAGKIKRIYEITSIDKPMIIK